MQPSQGYDLEQILGMATRSAFHMQPSQGYDLGQMSTQPAYYMQESNSDRPSNSGESLQNWSNQPEDYNYP